MYIPDGWWHVVVSPPGRNVAVAVEFEPWLHETMTQEWPEQVLKRYRWGGTFWAEQVAIKYAMRERLAATHYRAKATWRPISCERLGAAAPFGALSALVDKRPR